MRIIRIFDPWKSNICTCGLKYSFQPYTGCNHNCAYCYASTYIKNFNLAKPKKELFLNLEKDLREIDKNIIISMSNSSDPYPPIEKEKKITRNCLKLFKEYDAKVLIITKSDLVVRDADILSEMKCAVSITITGLDFLEPFAPSSKKRIEAIKKLKEYNIPTILRFDPIIPFLNENKFEIIEKAEPDHVVTSTLKIKPQIFERLSKFLPNDLKQKIYHLYFKEGEKINSYYYLKKELREKILRKVESFCKSLNISCAFCREGIKFDAKSCDGKHLIGPGGI